MCVGIASFLRGQGTKSIFAGQAGTAPTDPDTIPEDPQGDGYRGRRYRRRRRRERAGDYWDFRRARDRARRRPDSEDDLRIPEPDINDPNPTPSGGINY